MRIAMLRVQWKRKRSRSLTIFLTHSKSFFFRMRVWSIPQTGTLLFLRVFMHRVSFSNESTCCVMAVCRRLKQFVHEFGSDFGEMQNSTNLHILFPGSTHENMRTRTLHTKKKYWPVAVRYCEIQSFRKHRIYFSTNSYPVWLNICSFVIQNR